MSEGHTEVSTAPVSAQNCLCGPLLWNCTLLLLGGFAPKEPGRNVWVCSCNVSSLRASCQELADALLFWGAGVDLVPIQGLKVVPVDVSDTSSNKILLDLISANSWM